MSFAAMPAASARASSPPETTSAPKPSLASRRSTARLGLALIAKARCVRATPARPSRNTRAWRWKRRGGIDIDGRADFGGNARERHVLGVQFAVDQIEMVHDFPSVRRRQVELRRCAVLSELSIRSSLRAGRVCTGGLSSSSGVGVAVAPIGRRRQRLARRGFETLARAAAGQRKQSVPETAAASSTFLLARLAGRRDRRTHPHRRGAAETRPAGDRRIDAEHAIYAIIDPRVDFLERIDR